MKKSKTKAEREYMNRVFSLGCLICGKPPHLHHPTGAGMALKASNYDVIPLCPYHHQHGNYGEAVHNGTQEFERRYGTQEEMIARVKALCYQE